MGDRAAEENEDMTTKRTEKTDAANGALRTVEIIMGEFSGLGLCDIIAIYLALWTIDLDALVSMLDTESFTRLSQIAALQNKSVQDRVSNNYMPTSGNDIISVMTKFEQKVAEIYALMAKLMSDKQNNSTVSI